MTWVDRSEKIGRLILWLTISSAVVIVPLAVIGQFRTEAQQRDEARKADQALAKLQAESRPKRIPLKTMGAFLSNLNQTTGEGSMFFTNVSPYSGHLCVYGVATNATTGARAESVARCQAVAAYSSATLIMQFAANLRDVCKGGECALSVREAPDAPEPSPGGNVLSQVAK